MLEKEAWTGIARTKGGPCKVLVFHLWKLCGNPGTHSLFHVLQVLVHTVFFLFTQFYTLFPV